MMKIKTCLVIILFLLFGKINSQVVYNSTLLKADKLYIKHDYEQAVILYLKYLEKFPRDYFASRQAALCYNYLNRPSDAIDHWPIVVESSDATEKDYLEYARSLLVNDRGPEARKIFILLSKSHDKSIAAWGKSYLNIAAFYKDSANCRITEMNGINTDLPEFCPVLRNDKLFYVADKVRNVRQYIAVDDEATQSIVTALKKDSIAFTPALIFEKLQVVNINGQFCFSPDGNKIYVSKAVSSVEMKISSKTTFYRLQLFEIDITDPNSELKLRPFKYNTFDSDLLHPSISADGKKLFFSSNMRGSMGGKDIFVCEWMGGDWGPPKNAGQQVNTPGNEVFAHLDQDSTLYFASDYRPGLGGLDIFYTRLSSDGSFKEVKNAGAGINTRFDDFGIYILKEGNKGYFSSNRKNNTDDDIYYFFKSQ
jgi:Tol biopolymer transport system component